MIASREVTIKISEAAIKPLPGLIETNHQFLVKTKLMQARPSQVELNTILICNVIIYSDGFYDD
jgi:hypothetical protein